MPASYPTLLDIAQATGSDGIAGMIEEVIQFVPEVQFGAARTIKGTTFKTTVRVELPTGSGYRDANSGASAAKSRREQRQFECAIIDRPWLCDKVIADGHEDGAAAYIASEGIAVVQAQLMEMGRQFYYGVGNATKGHPGLLAMYDSANMTVDAGGTTANTGSSVWAVTWGEQGAQWLYGNGTNPLQLTDVKEVVLPDPNDSTKMLTWYHQQLLAWSGLKLGNLKTCARIKKLTAEAGKTLNDSLLRQLLQKYPIGYKPDAIFLTKRSMTQLIDSRTATTATGAEVPKPTHFDNVPLIETDSLLDTESLAL